MNKIDALFAAKQTHILSVFFPAGYPQLEDTLTILTELQKQGIDMVEVGIPFSDPMADGVVIQEASSKAITNGISLHKIFEQLQGMRNTITMPVILMGYLNPLICYGFEKFIEQCSLAGIDGLIIPDLPFNDYMQIYKPIVERYHLKMIMLITPETSDERILMIDNNTSGFIYMVSSASTTGVQNSFEGEKTEYFTRIDAMKLKNPRLIGFGVSNQQTFSAACRHAQGAIVGSHFVKLLSTEKNITEAVRKLKDSLIQEQ